MPHRYAIELLSDEGDPLAQVPVAPDWRPALDWVHFDGVRAGILPATTRTDPGTVEPIWEARVDSPYVAAFRVTLGAGERRVTRTIPRRYLESTAHGLIADFVQRKGTAAGSVLRWTVSAAPAAATDGDGHGDGALAVAPVMRRLPICDTPLAAFVAAACPVAAVGSGTGEAVSASRDHMPVFFPVSMLDETKELARRAGDVETGGVLVGRLHRDTTAAPDGTHDLFLEITAQIPALHTVATATTLTFTPETWAAARTAIARRDRPDEVTAGFWHSHLDWCRLRDCPLERRRTCSGARPFLSVEDVGLTAALFSAGHQLAMLVSDSAATGPITSLYGWSRGLLVPRAFSVLTKGASHAETRAS